MTISLLSLQPENFPTFVQTRDLTSIAGGFLNATGTMYLRWRVTFLANDEHP